MGDDLKTTIIKLRDAKKAENCTLTFGHFTTIHPGHIRYLKHAKTLRRNLYIAVQGDLSQDLPSSYHFTQKERAESLQLLGIAEKIILLEADEIEEAIKLIKPELLVIGDQHRNLNSLEKVVNLNGGKLILHAGDNISASVELLTNNVRDLDKKRYEEFAKSCARQEIQYSDLIDAIENMRRARLAVIGDTIVDQFAACEALGMSAEAPVIVVKELETKNFIGAAAVIAAHVKSIGADCKLISVVGEDSAGEFVNSYLEKLKINNLLVTDQSRPTSFKKRYVVESQKLFRVSRLVEHSIDTNTEDKIIAHIENCAKSVDGLVISDFVYGVITPRVLSMIKIVANKHKLMLFGDVQCSSQIGSILRFNDFTLLCPNEREARLALRNKEDGLESISYEIMEKTRCKKLVMKLGSAGLITYDKGEGTELISQHFPALSGNPVDVSGAGDSVLAVIATGLSSGLSLAKAAALACCAASIAVETMGNEPVGIDKLKKRLKEIFNKK
ncbi:PfkB family carbohydrate kinase [Prochlorococcus sp. MIT 1306]|uniref:PfkB family carbohydrate kinase n=1 Tax=Prochlorococcus sp. MIT 1306 TaxID=1799667 RepID=UPI0007B3AEBC|nr:PfkB family carbohydrate kinase [Prochlorococcus sp. MIT 1306]KZR61071.1 D-beta-D-heptose 7-phosphate kinase [Prochlorococcus sp. MIT 1306]